MLIERTIQPTQRCLSETAKTLLQTGRSQFRYVDCFDFVPSNYELVWRTLDSLPRGTFCEWGSGFGIITGLAQLLGFDSGGIEIDSGLVDASRKLLSEFDLNCEIQHCDYLESSVTSDYCFVYCWPGKMNQVESHFSESAPRTSQLLICHGADDIRCKIAKLASIPEINPLPETATCPPNHCGFP